MLVAVVGPCAAGKTTLVSGLRAHGYTAKQIAQEHSYVKDMWRRVTNPTHLIYLDVSYKHTIDRKNLSWTYDDYLIQVERLKDARLNAHFYIQTDDLTPQDVFEKVLNFLHSNDD